MNTRSSTTWLHREEYLVELALDATTKWHKPTEQMASMMGFAVAQHFAQHVALGAVAEILIEEKHGA